MRHLRSVLLGAAALGLLVAQTRANYLTNADVKDSLGGWHGDGERAFLRPDGSEGSDTDTDAIPVIKLKLGTNPVSVYENYEARDLPNSLHITVDVYASSDFKRATYTNDQTALNGSHIINGIALLDSDFWLQEMPSHYRKGLDVKPGKWATLDYVIRRMKALEDRTIYFWGTPGEGALYLRNPQVNK